MVFWICIGWVALVAFGAIFANLLPLKSPTFQNYSAIDARPSMAHLLGTDDLGRDLLSRIIYGSRRPDRRLCLRRRGMLIGGTGLISGYRGGRLDGILNAGSFVLLAFPAIVAVIAIVAFWGADPAQDHRHPRRGHHSPLIPGGPGHHPVLRQPGLRGCRPNPGCHEDSRILFREILPDVLPAAVSSSGSSPWPS